MQAVLEQFFSAFAGILMSVSYLFHVAHYCVDIIKTIIHVKHVS